MARTTLLTGVISLSTKKIVITEQIAIREQVSLHLTGYGSAGATDLVVALVHNGSLMAIKQGLTDYTTYIGGVLDLNTSEIVAVFSGMAANARVKMSIVIWDTTNQCTLVNDWIWILNNPYATSMTDPTPVDPIGAVEYAPVANGVTNGNTHTHQNGDGADLTPYLVARVTVGAHFRISTDGLKIELKDATTSEWRPLVLSAGALGVGPAV